MPRKSVFQIKGAGQDGLDIHPVRRIQNFDPDDFAVAGRVEIHPRRDLDGAVGRLVAQTQLQGIDVIVIDDSGLGRACELGVCEWSLIATMPPTTASLR
jgi:hypothetical protein